MSHVNRPTQISTILETISSGQDKKISTELESYIADLEAKQPNRPARIAEILRSIGAQYPAYIEDSLEVYIADLESSQQPVKPSINRHGWDSDNPPIWSHERAMQREHHRKERASQKRNDYRSR